MKLALILLLLFTLFPAVGLFIPQVHATQQSPSPLSIITIASSQGYGTANASCTLTGILTGDTVLVGVAYSDYNIGNGVQPQFFISDNNEYPWISFSSSVFQSNSGGVTPLVASTIFASTPIVTGNPTDVITVNVQNGVTPAIGIDCRLVTDVNVNLIVPGATSGSASGSFGTTAIQFFTGTPIVSNPAALYSIMSISTTTNSPMYAGAGFQQVLNHNLGLGGNTQLGLFAEGEVVIPAFSQNTPAFWNTTSGGPSSSLYGSTMSSLAIPLRQQQVIGITATTTVAATSIGQQTYTYSGKGFDPANQSSFFPTRFATSLVYIWYNAADYPITIQSLAIPILNSGQNNSLLIMGIYDTPSISSTTNPQTTPFTLLAVQTWYLQSGEALQNFTWGPNLQIAANSYYSIAVMDANASLTCNGFVSTTSTFATITGGVTTSGVTNIYHGGVYTRTFVINGTSTVKTSTGYYNTIIPCALSPATYYGIMNFTSGSGYVGGGFFNSNITQVNNPQTVMPSFFTPTMIIAVNTPMPDMSIVQVDNFQRVVTLTSTSTYVQGQQTGALNRIFYSNGSQAIILLIMLNIPIIFLGIFMNRQSAIDPRMVTMLVVIFIFIIDTLLVFYVKTPSGQPEMPDWGIAEQMLALFVILLRKGNSQVEVSKSGAIP